MAWFPAAMIIICILIPLEYRNGFDTPVRTKQVVVAGSYLLGLGLLMLFLRQQQDRWHWLLNDRELVGGRKRRNIYPFSSMAAIVPGLPAQKSIILAFAKSGAREAIAADRKISLLIVFKDGMLMPFHVHRCNGGTQLMTLLLAKCGDIVRTDYEYTEAELKALKFADWNRPVRPR